MTNISVTPNIQNYATTAPTGDKNLWYAKTPYKSGFWHFTHWNPQKNVGKINLLPIVTEPNGKQFIFLQLHNRPPFGVKGENNIPTIELPAGHWNNKETVEQAMSREIIEELEAMEELGQDFTLQNEPTLLAAQAFATSPAMTTETNVYGIAHISKKDTESKDENYIPKVLLTIKDPISEGHEDYEIDLIRGRLFLPLEVFKDDILFKKWLKRLSDKGYVVSNNVLCARALVTKQELNKTRTNLFA